jgi:hypothetical protein
MACRGVYNATEPEIVTRLLKADSERAVLAIVCEIERRGAEVKEWRHEVDKSWDALHRCLGDGTLDIPTEFAPLPAAVLGGEQLNGGRGWIISLVRPERVPAVADALGKITRDWLRRRYDALDPRNYEGEFGNEDFEYTWNWFKGLPDLFDRAARAGRAVIFVVDV